MKYQAARAALGLDARSSKVTVPDKLKDDAIVEALCELQFSCPEPQEVTIGRLLDIEAWKSFTKIRLLGADIPAPIRGIEPSLKFQPSFELRNSDSTRVIRIGQHAFSYHLLGKYCGWKKFKPELGDAFRAVFEALKPLTLTRVGLRYTNALVPSRHLISSVHDLNLKVLIDDDPVGGEINLNYVTEESKDHSCLSRVASPTFVQGKVPENTRVIIDVDVRTPLGYKNEDFSSLMNWIEDAHTYEKLRFFQLIPKNIIEKLVEG
jgi:uncharacterized protein (TIGR04255 family)